jgi:hypothetical protein
VQAEMQLILDEQMSVSGRRPWCCDVKQYVHSTLLVNVSAEPEPQPQAEAGSSKTILLLSTEKHN